MAVNNITPEMARAELERRKATAGGQITPEMARAELERRRGGITSTDDLLGALSAEDGLGGEMQEAPQQGNPVSRAIGDFADQRVLEGVPGAIVQGVGRAAQGVAADPLRTLVIDPATSLGRVGEPMRAIGPNLLKGNFAEAGRNTIDAATAAGEAALLVAAPGTGSIARQGAKSVAKDTGSQLLDDAARVGVDPTVPMAFPRTGGATAKQLAENLPAGVTTRAGADKTLKQLETALTKQADEYSQGASRTDAGASAREGAQRFNRKSLTTPDESATIREPAKFSSFRDKAEAIYSKAYRGFDANAKSPTPSTTARLQDVNSRFADQGLSDLFSLPVAKKLDEVLAGGKVSIADMRALRTEIRDIQNNSKLMKTRDDAALERLESALTDDIYAAVEASGGKSALQNLKRADRYYRLGAERIKKGLEPFAKDAATDESATQAILRAARGQGKGDIQRLRALRRSLRPDEMDDVSAGILREMGRAKEGADFSPETFARNWQTMGDDAKTVLFNRAQRPEVRQNLDALARLIERQSNVESLSNRSRSGANAQNFGTAIAFMAEPVTATAAVVGANGFGRLLMSPSFTKALLQMQRAVPNAAKSGANAARERAKILALISAAEQSDASIRPYTAEIRAALKASNDNQAPSQSGQARQLPPE